MAKATCVYVTIIWCQCLSFFVCAGVHLVWLYVCVCVCVCVCVFVFLMLPHSLQVGLLLKGKLFLAVPENWHVNKFSIVRNTVPLALTLTILGHKKKAMHGSYNKVITVSKTGDIFLWNRRRSNNACGQSMNHTLNMSMEISKHNIPSLFTAVADFLELHTR